MIHDEGFTRGFAELLQSPDDKCYDKKEGRMSDVDGEGKQPKEEKGQSDQGSTARKIGKFSRREIHDNRDHLLKCVEQSVGFYSNVQDIRYVENDERRRDRLSRAYDAFHEEKPLEYEREPPEGRAQ